MSSLGPHRPPDETDAPSRQSPPPISKAICGENPSPHRPPGLSWAYISREDSSSGTKKYSSLHPLTIIHCQETISSLLSELPRPPFSGMQRFPIAYGRLPPIGKPEQPLQLSPTHSSEPHPVSILRDHQQSRHAWIPSSRQSQATQFPADQMHWQRHPISPQHSPPRGHKRLVSDYTLPSARHIETWDHHETFNRILSHSKTIHTLAEAYSQPQHLQHENYTNPKRLPTELEIREMIANADNIKRLLEQAHPSLQLQPTYQVITSMGPHDTSPVLTDDDDMRPQTPASDIKKRRGLAASPGRCHNCNRTSTPEWRRGPHGARTLCNACGLHYAKFGRQRLFQAREIHPKSEERHSAQR